MIYLISYHRLAFKLFFLTGVLFLLMLIFNNREAKAAEIEICGDIAQGELVIGRQIKAMEVFFNDQLYKVNQDNGEVIVAIGRDFESPAKFQLVGHTDKQYVFQIPVEKTKWDTQNIKGVPQRKVTPYPGDEAEIARERKDISKALQHLDWQRNDWKDGFILPVNGVISGNFGNQRIFNGIPKNPHSGTDIAASEGTPVSASAAGKVLLAGGNYFYSGNVVIIDHGSGLQTIYAHLKDTSVRTGDMVKQNQIIGTVGKTGRVTGPHLHWGASLHNVRFRPHSLLDLNSKICRKYKSVEK